MPFLEVSDHLPLNGSSGHKSTGEVDTAQTPNRVSVSASAPSPRGSKPPINSPLQEADDQKSSVSAADVGVIDTAQPTHSLTTPRSKQDSTSNAPISFLSEPALAASHNRTHQKRYLVPQTDINIEEYLGFEKISPALQIPHPSEVVSLAHQLPPAARKYMVHIERVYYQLCQTVLSHEALRQRQAEGLRSGNANNKHLREGKQEVLENEISKEAAAQQGADNATIARDEAAEAFHDLCSELGLHPTEVSLQALIEAVEQWMKLDLGRKDSLLNRALELKDQLRRLPPAADSLAAMLPSPSSNNGGVL